MQKVNGWVEALLRAVENFILLGVVCGVCAVPGSILGGMSFTMLGLVAPGLRVGSSGRAWQMLFATGGALLGAGCGLALLAKLWWAEARRSDDPGVRDLVRRVDILRGAQPTAEADPNLEADLD